MSPVPPSSILWGRELEEILGVKDRVKEVLHFLKVSQWLGEEKVEGESGLEKMA